ncbi:MAG TPA: tetratricopeptide repeat protein, partial [Rhodanobacteraceae bacterium]|nr:tetratricopeptide repeat protein [Rhodanobacteraceae bacterium]
MARATLTLPVRAHFVLARGILMKLEFRWLVFGMCSALALALLPVAAYAQMGGQQCSDIQMLQHKCGKQDSKQSKSKQGSEKSKYPNATRKQPSKLGVSNAKEAKTLNEGLAAANSGDSATALKDLQPIADSSSSAYAKSLATLGLAQVKYRGGDTKGAIALQKQALDSNALDN